MVPAIDELWIAKAAVPVKGVVDRMVDAASLLAETQIGGRNGEVVDEDRIVGP